MTYFGRRGLSKSEIYEIVKKVVKAKYDVTRFTNYIPKLPFHIDHEFILTISQDILKESFKQIIRFGRFR